MNLCIPVCTVSVPYDVAVPTPLSSRHWKTPSSSGATCVTTSEDPEIWKRRDDVGMGSALNSQVTFGEGFPLAVQVKRAEEPAVTTRSSGPSTTETGSVGERQTNQFRTRV